jgi:hypothetical protein
MQSAVSGCSGAAVAAPAIAAPPADPMPTSEGEVTESPSPAEEAVQELKDAAENN